MATTSRDSAGQIFSIGYGGRSLREVVAQLRRAEVQFVVDVRTTPYSRYQPDFTKEPLELSLANDAIRYVFMGDTLGGRPDDDDCYTDGRVDYSKCKTTETFKTGLARLVDAHQQGFRLCLLCSESKPEQCHRSKLIGVALDERGIQVRHLTPNGNVLSQADVINILTGGQVSIFESGFRSRGTYR